MNTVNTFMLPAVSTPLILVFNCVAVSKYQDADLRKCCEDGMKINPMKLSCSKRLTRVTGTPKCKEAFKDCCESAIALRKEEAAKRRTAVSLARSKKCYTTV